MPDQASTAGLGGATVVGTADVPEPFAGDLFLTLAAAGRLVVDPVRADALIADLQRTLDLIITRLRLVRIWQRLPEPAVDNLPAEFSQYVVDAVFVDQLAPGQLERAVRELPKYIEALQVARRSAPPA
jgi:hypothetical protein